MKTLVTLTAICIIILSTILACSKSSNKPSTPTGRYKLTGTIIDRAYPSWPNIGNLPPTYTTIPFDTVLRIEAAGVDTFRLYGLGFNRGNFRYMDTQDGPDCPYNYCGFFSLKKNDSLVFIQVVDPGGVVTGGARYIKDSIYLTYYHEYRNHLWTFAMAGKRQ